MKKIVIALLMFTAVHIHGVRSSLVNPVTEEQRERIAWNTLCEDVRRSLINGAQNTKDRKERDFLLKQAANLGKPRQSMCQQASRLVKKAATIVLLEGLYLVVSNEAVKMLDKA